MAHRLKQEWRTGGNRPILQGKSLALVFQKPSLRTRVSFEMGMVHLGGYAFYLSPNEVKMGGRESIPDVACVLSGYVDGVMARVFDHHHILQLAEYSRVPIINGLSDYNHPAQAFADIFTIQEQKGQLPGLKLAYVGDGNNVARSLLFGAMKMGMHFADACPPNYTLTEEDYHLAQSTRTADWQQIDFVEKPADAVRNADIIYTDVWLTSMGQEEEPTAASFLGIGPEPGSRSTKTRSLPAVPPVARGSCRVDPTFAPSALACALVAEDPSSLPG